jgi:hypothetical protein
LADFDLKKMSTNDWIIGGGCIAMFIGVFLPWIGAEVCFLGQCVGGNVNGFHYFLQGTIPWIIAILLLAVLIIRKFVPEVSLPDKLGSLSWAQVYLIASAVAAVLVLLRLITGDSGLDRKIGLFLSSIGVVAMVVGSYLKFQSKEDDAVAGPGTTPPTPF